MMKAMKKVIMQQYIFLDSINELRNLNTKNVTRLYMGGDDTVGKLFEVGYYTEEEMMRHM